MISNERIERKKKKKENETTEKTKKGENEEKKISGANFGATDCTFSVQSALSFPPRFAR